MSWIFLTILSSFISSNLCISINQYGNGICYKPQRLFNKKFNKSYYYRFPQENPDLSERFKSNIIRTEGKSSIPYCCPGYEEVNQFGENLICVPVCNPQCVNSKCTSPNTCTCLDGYTLLEDSKTCSADRYFSQKLSLLTDDTSGYMNHLSKNKITGMRLLSYSENDRCGNQCNGYCDEHEKCVCYEGYRLSGDRDVCVPVCENECINATCIAPNHCACHKSYVRNQNKANECNPICNPQCIFGECIEPDTCECHTNYTHKADLKNVCYPVCDNCTNGMCTSPNVCQCFPSYYFQNGDCHPICDPKCINGKCIEPNKCECLKGYEKNPSREKHECDPQCNPKCINAQCVAPNTCECLSNYKKNSQNDSFCEPICKNGCINGRCVMPDQCICNEGYTQNDTSSNDCIPICHPPCVNAKCIGHNICECNDNFFKPSNNNSHLCESKISICKKNIKTGIKKVDDLLCYEFDNMIKTYDKQCRIDFTNTSCYDEFCKNNISEICNMVYSCDIWQDILNSSSIVAHCQWEQRVLDNGNREDSFSNIFDEELFPNISGIFYEHSFKVDFDSSPCLLCFCPYNDQRQACYGDKISFKICQCTDDDFGKVLIAKESSEGWDHKVIRTTIIIAFIAMCLIFFGISAVFIIKAYRMQYSNVYRVQTYHNAMYEGQIIGQAASESLLET